MFVLNILLHLHIFWTVWKGAMANKRAVTDGLNGYESFRAPAKKDSKVPSRLRSNFSLRRSSKNPLLVAYLIAAFAP